MEKKLQKIDPKNGFRDIKLGGGEAPFLKIHEVNRGHRIKNSLDAQDCATSSVDSPRFEHTDEQ